MEEERIYKKELLRDVDSGYDPGRLVYFLFDLIELLLLGRFVLKGAGANPLNGFVQFIYAFTEPLIFPFRGIFPLTQAGPGVIEWATIIAIIIYAILAILLVRVLRLIFKS